MVNPPVAENLRFMRETNTAATLEHLRGNALMSVSDLAGATGLSRQAVSRSLNVLQQEGLVELLPPDRTSPRSGRPARLARFRAEAGYVVGALINPQQVRLMVADLNGTVVASALVVLSEETEVDAAVELLVQHTAQALSEAGTTPDQVRSAAIGVPGIVDPSSGVVKWSPSMSDLRAELFVQGLEGYLDCPVAVDNDMKFASKGEQWQGGWRDDGSLVVVHWGERIGAGILVDGTVYRGASNDAGNLGFLDLVIGTGHLDTSQTLGRFEGWAGASALIHLATEELQTTGDHDRCQRLIDAGHLALEEILDGVQAEEPAFVAALQQLAQRFAPGLAAIRTLLDPHLVVFSGPIAAAAESLLDALHECFADYPLELPEIRISRLGDDAVVHGAIRHCLNGLEQTRYSCITQGASRH